MDTTDSCLDAETLAAWVEGGLSHSEVERARTHVADCARCQALVGTLARISSAVPATAAEPAGRRWLGWLVPLTAAAAAVALWVVVPRSQLESRVTFPQAQERPSEPAPAIPQEASKVGQAQSSVQAPAPEAPRPAELRRDAAPPATLDKLSKDAAASGAMTAAVSESPQASNAPAAPPAQPQAASANALESVARSAGRRELAESPAALDIISPDPAFRWRIAGSVVQRSTNGGGAWEITPAGVTTELTAGAAPSSTVCWLVGRAGVVLLSTDGRTWRRVPFPEIADLSAVRARDERSASVTTVDGRTFSTTVAGTQWVPGPLQGFPPAPF